MLKELYCTLLRCILHVLNLRILNLFIWYKRFVNDLHVKRIAFLLNIFSRGFHY